MSSTVSNEMKFGFKLKQDEGTASIKQTYTVPNVPQAQMNPQVVANKIKNLNIALAGGSSADTLANGYAAPMKGTFKYYDEDEDETYTLEQVYSGTIVMTEEEVVYNGNS